MRDIATRAQRLPLGMIAGAVLITVSGMLTVLLTSSVGMALAVTALVACALVAVAMLATTPEDTADLAQVEEPRRPKTMRAQLLFADCEPGRVVVDALVLDSSAPFQNGLPLSAATPLALEMRMPAAEWFSASIGDLLDEWADDSEMVDLELLHGALGPRVRLAREEARITLDLTRVDGVPAPLALGSA
jgi:hypothetical protein